MSKKLTVVFAGLGNMGLPMATNLNKANLYNLLVSDTSKSQISSANGLGLKTISNQEIGSSNPDVVLTMLPNADILSEFYNPLMKQLKNAEQKKLFIDCSTIGPIAAKKIGSELDKHDFDFVDAPVSGGVVGARDSTLTFMVGAETENVFNVGLLEIERNFVTYGQENSLMWKIGNGTNSKDRQ